MKIIKYNLWVFPENSCALDYPNGDIYPLVYQGDLNTLSYNSKT